jgi:NADPH:quinone reductase-like Zn-dependent oxidoreductase
VTGVDSAEKLGMLRSVGADEVIDYTQRDYTRSGETYDFILDLVNRSTSLGITRSLEQNGCYLAANAGALQRLRGRWFSTASSKKVIGGNTSYKTVDLVFLKELIEAGKMRLVIDKRYPLEQVAEAHRYVETGRKKGHVVLIVKPTPKEDNQ